MDNFELVCLACKSIEENEGKDIVVVDTRKVQNLVEYVVFVSAKDHSLVSSIADKVTAVLSKKGVHLLQREGFGITDWVALDFGAFFVHIFTKDVRDKYNIEKLMSDGKNSKKYEVIKKEAQKTAKKQLEIEEKNEKIVKAKEKEDKKKEDKVKEKTSNKSKKQENKVNSRK